MIRTGPTRPLDEIYERDVRKQVEADHDGEVVAIDVASGCWAIAADTTPLVGMRLLDGHSLYMEVQDGGRVVIQATA